MSHWDEFGHCIINDDLDAAVAALEAVIDGCGDLSRSSNPALRAEIENILV